MYFSRFVNILRAIFADPVHTTRKKTSLAIQDKKNDIYSECDHNII